MKSADLRHLSLGNSYDALHQYCVQFPLHFPEPFHLLSFFTRRMDLFWQWEYAADRAKAKHSKAWLVT
jgi:hypothetical protein